MSSKTLGQYLKELRPTEKQMSLIYAIEDTVGPIWEGKTKEDATRYISKYIDAYVAGIRFQMELDAIEFESEHGDWGCRD